MVCCLLIVPLWKVRDTTARSELAVRVSVICN